MILLTGRLFSVALSPQGSGQDGGTLPRAIDVVFNSIEELQTKKYLLKPDKLNGFEIQNEADAANDR